MKRQRFHVGQDVAVCKGDYVIAMTKVVAIDDRGVRTEYTRKAYHLGGMWTATGLEPHEEKANRLHIRASIPADGLELDRRDLVRYLKEVNWDKIELPLLIGVRMLLSGGEGVKLRSVPG